ncbi:hypothetical protein [Thermostichus vulcanus]|nr:hypothetical protein [Thermostichus vulcanus]
MRVLPRTRHAIGLQPCPILTPEADNQLGSLPRNRADPDGPMS